MKELGINVLSYFIDGKSDGWPDGKSDGCCTGACEFSA